MKRKHARTHTHTHTHTHTRRDTNKQPNTTIESAIELGLGHTLRCSVVVRRSVVRSFVVRSFSRSVVRSFVVRRSSFVVRRSSFVVRRWSLANQTTTNQPHHPPCQQSDCADASFHISILSHPPTGRKEVRKGKTDISIFRNPRIRYGTKGTKL